MAASDYFYFLIFFFGAIVGSFLNVVILRYNSGRSIFSGRSECFSCGKKLRWFELVPVFSFFWQEGRCGNCGSRISFQYPIVEILTGLIFLLIFNFSAQGGPAFGGQFFAPYTPLSTLYFLIIFSLLIVIAVYDYHHQIIPDLFVWTFNGLAFLNLFNIWNLKNLDLFGNPPAGQAGWKLIIENFDSYGLLAGFILSAFFALLWGMSKGKWMGLGDAKLALGLGWLLGLWKGIAAVTLSFWLGAAVGIFLLLAARGRYNIKSGIAFGPFLVLGAAASFFYGEQIINFFFQGVLF